MEGARVTGVDQSIPDRWSCEISFLDEHAVLTVSGELDMATGPALLEAVDAAIQRPISRLSLDLAGVPFIDSGGVRALLTAQRTSHDRGITFVLMSLPAQGRRVLEISGLTNVFGARPTFPVRD